MLLKVTGGSNGIGREICLQLAKDGCNVAILDMDLCGAERTCHDIRQFGVTAIPYKVCAVHCFTHTGSYSAIILSILNILDRRQ